MRYELSDYEWPAIKPMLPNKPRGVRRVNDRRVLNGIFWVLVRVRHGATCQIWALHDLLQSLRSLAAGWHLGPDHGRLAAAHNGAVQMIDTSVVRVHQHGACVAGNREQHMGRSRGGLTRRFTQLWMPMACLCNLASHPAKLTTIGSARSY